MPTSVREPWFAERTVPVYFFKVNRRAVAQANFIVDAIDDPFEHLVTVLLFGAPVQSTGRGSTRTWRLGDPDPDYDARTLAGQIGWEQLEAREGGTFDEKRVSWVDAVEQTSTIAHAPFLYDGETGRLAVRGHPSFLRRSRSSSRSP